MTGHALLRAILEAPADDGVRLVYADWLEENGDGERAAFIRAQVRRAGRGGRGTPADWVADEIDRRREQELLAAHGMDFLPEIVRLTRFSTFADGGVLMGWTTLSPTAGDKVYATFARGFVAAVTLSAADWLAHGDALSWSPEQTEPCPDDHPWSGHPRGLIRDHDRDPWRPNCDLCKGSGRVPRPVPPTAQPITEVRLASGLDPFMVGRLSADCGGVDMATEAGIEQAHRWIDDPLPLLRRRWPAVEKWELPPARAMGREYPIVPTAATRGAVIRIGDGPPIRVDNIRVVLGDGGRQTVEAETEDGRTLTFTPNQLGTQIELTADAEVTYLDPDLWRQVAGGSPRMPRRSRLPAHLRSPSVPRRPR